MMFGAIKIKKQLTTFVQWFFKDEQDKQLNFTKVFTAFPLLSAVGYVLIHFIMFVIDSFIYTYYGINMSYYSYHEGDVYRILLIGLIFLSLFIYLGTTNKYKSKIDKIFIDFAGTYGLIMLFCGFLENARIDVPDWEAYCIFFGGIVIIIVTVWQLPKHLKPLRAFVILTVVCMTLSAVLSVTMSTYFKGSYDTVHYDSKSFIIGANLDNKYYLIEFNGNKILCNHYRLVDKTQVSVIREKINLYVDNK